MAQFDLFIDVVAGNLVQGLTNPGVINPPPIVEGDTPTWRIWLLQPTGNPIAPYVYIPTAGLSIQAALGDKIGNTTNYYTTQFTWAPSTDPNNPNYWIATMPFNTNAITTLIGSASSAQTTLEIKYISGGVPTTVYQKGVSVQAAVIKNNGVVLPPGLTPASMEYVNATFLKQTIVGPFFLVDPNTNKKVAIYLGDDNTLHVDPVN